MEHTIEVGQSLEHADAARFRQLLDDMKFRIYRRVRAERLDKPLSYFEPLGYTADELRLMENRFQREVRA